MASVAAPYGLRPVKHATGGQIRPVARTILSTYAANIFQGSPVKIHTDGTVQIAAAGDRMVGSFDGCEYTSGGRRVISNFWPSGTAATDIVAYIYEDPEIIYQMQCAGSVALADIGGMQDHSGVSGSTVTGNASTALAASPSATVEASFQILDIAPIPGNAAGDSFTDVYVKLVEHQYRAIADAAQAF
jgi:hypothetical protein